METSLAFIIFIDPETRKIWCGPPVKYMMRVEDSLIGVPSGFVGNLNFYKGWFTGDRLSLDQAKEAVRKLIADDLKGLISSGATLSNPFQGLPLEFFTPDLGSLPKDYKVLDCKFEDQQMIIQIQNTVGRTARVIFDPRSIVRNLCVFRGPLQVRADSSGAGLEFSKANSDGRNSTKAEHLSDVTLLPISTRLE